MPPKPPTTKPPKRSSKTKSSASTSATKHTPASPAKNTYLLAYNALSAALWAGVLYQTVTIGAREVSTARKSGLFFGGQTGLKAVQTGLSSGKVYGELERYTRLTQSLAGLEVLHSLLGVVRAPLFTTVMQVASRFLLVWGIAYNFPQTTQHSPAYSSMLLAWSFTEVVRYSYFVFSLSGVGVPKVWTWLRYNTFMLLYPLGIASECWLVYQAMAPVKKVWGNLGVYALWAILAVYVPGSYVLFTYMLGQRKKIQRESRRRV